MTDTPGCDWTKPEAYPDDRPQHERIIDLVQTAQPGFYRVGGWFISVGPAFELRLPPDSKPG